MKRLLLAGLAALCAVLLLNWHNPPRPARADVTFIVNSTNDTVDAVPGDGACETMVGNGICTLRAAIQEANALAGADTIVLPVGDFTLTGASGDDAALSGDLDITSSLTINGSSAAGTRIIGDGDRVFDIRDGATVTISNVTVRNGSGVTEGGGIRLVSGTLTLNNSRVGDMTVGNSATNGGGIFQAGGTLILNNTTVSHNPAGTAGGGVYVANGSLTVNNSTFGPSNTAVSNGGGLFVLGSGSATLNNSTFSGNAAENGGAVYASGSVALNSATLANNSAGTAGGGIYQLGAAVSLRNTLLATNTALVGPDCSGTVSSAGHNLAGNIDGCNGIFNGVNGDQAGSGGMVLNPNIGALNNNGGLTNTHALNSNSTAIDAGNPGGCGNGGGNFSTDQRGPGFPRAIDGNVDGVTRCDIGAYESGPTGATVTPSMTFTPTETHTPAPTASPTLTETPAPTGTPVPTGSPTPAASPTPEAGGKLPPATSGAPAGAPAAANFAATQTVSALQTLVASSPTATLSPEEVDLTSTAVVQTAAAQAPTALPSPTLIPTITPTFAMPAEDVSLSTSRNVGVEGGVVTCGIWFVGVRSASVPENSVFRCETISQEEEERARLPLNHRPFWHIVDVNAFDAGGQALTRFNPPLSICAYYADSYLDSVGGDPARLVIYTADGVNRPWTALTTTPENGVPRVCAESDRLSLFRLVAQPSPLVSRLTSPLALIITGAVCLLLAVVLVIVIALIARRGRRNRAEAPVA